VQVVKRDPGDSKALLRVAKDSRDYKHLSRCAIFGFLQTRDFRFFYDEQTILYEI
jgi:hypothetical protein